MVLLSPTDRLRKLLLFKLTPSMHCTEVAGSQQLCKGCS